MADGGKLTVTLDTSDTLRVLAARAFANSAAHGFWDDAPPTDHEAWGPYIGNKLMLIVGEVAEAHEELRKGRAPGETYYLDGAGEEPLPAFLEDAAERGALLKPEGFPSELADVLIRVLDLAGALGIDLGAVLEEKAAYNATRPAKHGKAF